MKCNTCLCVAIHDLLEVSVAAEALLAVVGVDAAPQPPLLAPVARPGALAPVAPFRPRGTGLKVGQK